MPELDNTSQVIDTNPAPVGATPEPAALTVTEKVETTPNWEEAADAEMSAIFRKNHPERAEDGKFASREPNDETSLPDQAPIEKVEQPVAVINAPQSWSAEMKAVFPSLPPAAQEFIAKRESEAQAKITQQGQELSSFEPIKSVIEQHRDIFERNGLEYDDGLARMLNAERMLERDPVAAIGMIAQAYGVNLGQLAGQQQPQDSATSALHQRIAQLESQLNDTSSRIQQRERAEAETQQKSAQSIIEKFSQDKSDWADLENDVLVELTGINAAIESGLMQSLTPDQKIQKAYDRAQRNNPDAWAKKQEADRKAEEAKKLAEAQKRADEAKRSKVVNISSSPASGKQVSSMDDTLRETFRKAQSA